MNGSSAKGIRKRSLLGFSSTYRSVGGATNYVSSMLKIQEDPFAGNAVNGDNDGYFCL